MLGIKNAGSGVLQSDLDALQSQLTAKNTQITNLNAQLTAKDTELVTKAQEVAALNAKLSNAIVLNDNATVFQKNACVNGNKVGGSEGLQNPYPLTTVTGTSFISKGKFTQAGNYTMLYIIRSLDIAAGNGYPTYKEYAHCYIGLTSGSEFIPITERMKISTSESLTENITYNDLLVKKFSAKINDQLSFKYEPSQGYYYAVYSDVQMKIIKA